MAVWARHGLPAGVSTLLAFFAGALTNVVTAGWNWPVGIGLGVLVTGWVGLEMRLAAQAIAGDRIPTRGAASVPGATTIAGESVVQAPVLARQLPAANPHFVGRSAELAELTKVLEELADMRGAVAVVAIGGTAGVGKTALVVHWAHRVRDRFPDGQLYVDLRGFGPAGAPVQPAAAVRGFLDALQVPPQRIPADLDTQTALYRSLLADKRMLVVLDNARDPAQVRPLLPGSAGCLAVVTSRRVLTGLVAAEGARPLPVGLFSTVEACALLARRLGGERVSAEMDATNEIVELCAHLPLALAVVAAHAATRPDLSLGGLARALRVAWQRLDAYDTGDSLTDVRAVLSWSYRALTGPAARLFRLLGLHPDPDMSIDAAASLVGLPPGQVRMLLAELTGAHLLVERAPGRYMFHDLLHAYAREQADKLDTDDERRDATCRMLDHYLHTAYAASWRLNPHRDPIALAPPAPGTTVEDPTDYEQAMTWFTDEHQVLLAMVDRAANGFDAHTWQLARALATYLNRRGHWHGHVSVQVAAVAAAQRLGDLAAQANAHRRLAEAHIYLGRYDEAHAHLREGIDLAVRAGDRITQAHTQHRLSYLYERLGEPSQALDHAQQALFLFEAAGHRVGLARTLNAVGWYHAQLGNHRQALTHCQRALALHQQLGDAYGQANTWDSLGYAYHHFGHHNQALVSFQHALELRRQLADSYWEAETLGNLGETYRTIGDIAAARTAWQEALAILDVLEHPDADLIRAKVAGLEVA